MSHDVRINNSEDNYLYCDVNDNPCDYADQYNSAEACIADIMPDVEQCCQRHGYNEHETETVKNNYAIKLSNYDGEWKAAE